jgi:hypothetical protein
MLAREIYWLQRAKCDKGKHKLRDNEFRVTWCVTCGLLSNKLSGISLTEQDKIINKK